MLLLRQTRPAKCCAVSFKNLIIDLKTKQEGYCLYSFAFPSMDYLWLPHTMRPGWDSSGLWMIRAALSLQSTQVLI